MCALKFENNTNTVTFTQLKKQHSQKYKNNNKIIKVSWLLLNIIKMI